MNAYEIVQRLTRQAPDSPGYGQLISEFSYQFGWRPSDAILDRATTSYPGVLHLLTEYGLRNAAVLTFLPEGTRTRDLQIDQRRALLSLSYNNLVDWHVWIDQESVSYLYNRRESANEVARFELTRGQYEGLARDRLAEAIGLAPNPNILALDDALIDTLSSWKKLLGADLEGQADNSNYSALFNAILLARAVEDFYSAAPGIGEELLRGGTTRTVARTIRSTIKRLTNTNPPAGLVDWSRLQVFDQLDAGTIHSLFNDFYRHRGVPYRYDFSVMSKHALSRVYERYVSILKYPDNDGQLRFLPPVPDEEPRRASGAVYTPEFIARFFARFLQENLPPRVFREARVADFACGSGIFLRTILETQLQSLGAVRSPTLPTSAVKNLLGIDNDQNACDATRLSIAVLHLVATGKFPRTLNIQFADALDFFDHHPEQLGTFDAFVVNPPYIQIESQTEDMRSKIADSMAKIGAGGRLDSYLPFLVMGIQSLKAGGFGLFVLPQTFLVSQSAAPVREWIRHNAEIRCLADLSHLPVFEDVGSYVVLLALERKPAPSAGAPAAIVRCRAQAGHALQDLLDGRRSETDHYVIFDAKQRDFDRADWGTFLLLARLRLNRNCHGYLSWATCSTSRRGSSRAWTQLSS